MSLFTKFNEKSLEFIEFFNHGGTESTELHRGVFFMGGYRRGNHGGTDLPASGQGAQSFTEKALCLVFLIIFPTFVPWNFSATNTL